jgi:hypothetical protein
VWARDNTNNMSSNRNSSQNDEVKKIVPLRGHVSADTAFVVDDYPYGFRLRCKKRYWVESKRGNGTRLVTQTSNPKADATATVWNKPKHGIYYQGVRVLFLDGEGHVVGDGCDTNAVGRFEEFRARFDLTVEELAELELLERISRKVNPNSWALWDAEQQKSEA